MKKITFTISSILVVCATIFMACEKNTSTAVTAATTGNTTASTGPNTMVVDGSSHTVATGTNVIGTNYVLVSSTVPGAYPSISLTFSGTVTPTAGTYTANANYPTTGNCGTILTPSTSVTWTVVSCNINVTSGSSKAMSFTNATFTDGTNTHTVTANLPF